MEQNPSSETNSLSASREITRVYGTRRFITVFTRVHHLSLSRADEFSPQFPVLFP